MRLAWCFHDIVSINSINFESILFDLINSIDLDRINSINSIPNDKIDIGLKDNSISIEIKLIR